MKRLFVFFLAAVFFLETLPIYGQTSMGVSVPERYGKIEGSSDLGGKGSVIIIKDTHCNYEASRNIVEILKILITEYKIDLIGIEGASGKVDISSIVSGDIEEELRKKVAGKYLREGWFSPVESLALELGNGDLFEIWGVEDRKIYLEDMKSFREVYSNLKDVKGNIEEGIELIKKVKPTLYKDKLCEFDKKVTAYMEGRIGLGDFLDYLFRIDPGRFMKYRELKYTLYAIRLERSIDPSDVEKDRLSLIKELSKRLPIEELQELINLSLLHNVGKISTGVFYENLGQYIQYKEKDYKDLYRYLRLLRLNGKIDSDRLFYELDCLVEDIYSLFVDEKTKEIHMRDNSLRLLKRFVELDLRRDEFFRLVDIIPKLRDVFVGIDVDKIEGFLNQPNRFYEFAIQRDTILTKNLLSRMEETGKRNAALVVGGFHIEAVKDIVAKAGYTPVVIKPVITKNDLESKRIYLARMMDEAFKPEMLLVGMGQVNLMPPIIASWPEEFAGIIKEVQRVLGKPIGEINIVEFRDAVQGMVVENEVWKGFIGLLNEELQKHGVSPIETGPAHIEWLKTPPGPYYGPTGLDPATLAEQLTKIESTLTARVTLKAPGSLDLDEDTGLDSEFLGEQLTQVELSKGIKEKVVINVIKSDLLGLQRRRDSTNPQDIIYAYGVRMSDGNLHIYVTAPFLTILKTNPLMLAFLIDHEWQENMEGKSHAEASKRAWSFTDPDGMNPFYRFYLELLESTGQEDELSRFANKGHPNDPEGKFSSYARLLLFGKKEISEIALLRSLVKNKNDGRVPRVLNLYASYPGSGTKRVASGYERFGKEMGWDISSNEMQISPKARHIMTKIRYRLEAESGGITDEELEEYERFNAEVLDSIRLEDTDILIINNHEFLAMVPHIKERYPHIKIIWHCHLAMDNVYPKNAVWQRLKGYVNQVDYVILQPGKDARNVYSSLDIDVPTVTIPPAVIDPTSDIDRILTPDELEGIGNMVRAKKRLADITKEPYFLFMNRPDPEKGCINAIDAFEILIRRMAGEGMEQRPNLILALFEGDMKLLEERLDRLDEDIKRNIHIIILSSSDDLLINYLQTNALAGIQLSEHEGFGLPVSGMMYKGNPVIGRDTGGIATQITDGINGFLVKDNEEAADRMLRLFVNKENIRGYMGEKARQYAKEHYLLSGLVKGYSLVMAAVFDKDIQTKEIVDIDNLYNRMWLTRLFDIAIELQNRLQDSITHNDLKEAWEILLEFYALNARIEEQLTSGGTLSALVFEKLENIIYEILRRDRGKPVSFTCISLPIASLNTLGYEMADRFKDIFYREIDRFMKNKGQTMYAQYKFLGGANYGFASTRLYVLGLEEADLAEITGRIFIESLREAGLKEEQIKNTRIFAGHIMWQIPQWMQDRFDLGESMTKKIDRFIEGVLIEATGRAEAIEKGHSLREFRRARAYLTEDDPILKEEPVREEIKIYGRNYIPEGIYKPGDRTHGMIPHLSHPKGYLWLLYRDLAGDIGDAGRRTSYFSMLNKYLMESIQDPRCDLVYKLKYFKSLLTVKGHPGIVVTKMGDEIWIYCRMEDGSIRPIFLEINKFNAFNKQILPDFTDSYYHVLFENIHKIYNEVNGDYGSFVQKLSEGLFNVDVTFDKGSTVRSQKAEVNGIEIPEVSIFSIEVDKDYNLGDIEFQASEKVKIGGVQERLWLYYINQKGSKWFKRPVVIWNNRVYTADGKGEDEEDITDELSNEEISSIRPFVVQLGVTVTTDKHGLTALDEYTISDLNTYQKKKMKKGLADSIEIISQMIADDVTKLEASDRLELKGRIVRKIEALIAGGAGEELDLARLIERTEGGEFAEIVSIICYVLDRFIKSKDEKELIAFIAPILREIISFLREKDIELKDYLGRPRYIKGDIEEIDRFAAGMDAISKDVGHVTMEDTEGVVILNQEDWLTFNPDGSFQMRPGLEIVFRNLKGSKNRIVIMAEAEDVQKIEYILMTVLEKDNFSVYPKGYDVEGELIREGTLPENIVRIEKGLTVKPAGSSVKFINMLEGTNFHTLILFAFLYAKTSDPEGLIRQLVGAGAIEDLKAKGFITVKFVNASIKEILEIMENTRQYIEISA